MRKLSVVLFGLAACGGSSDTPSDAPLVKLLDASIDARPDAPPLPPPDAPPVYDFSCLGMQQGAAAAQVKVMGTTQTFQGMNLAPVVGATIESFKNGNPTPLDTVTSDDQGNFTTGNLPTNGTPLDGFVKASKGGGDIRTTFVYPSAPLVADLSGVPFLMLPNSIVGLLSQFPGGETQDDNANGLLFVAVTDCAGTQIDGATITVQQNNVDAGKQLDISALLGAQGAGTFIVENVPDGLTQVSGAYGGHTFPTHTVRAYKKDTTAIPNGSVTLTVVRPGP